MDEGGRGRNGNYTLKHRLVV